ncbi:hypothetical protein AVEN_4077-1 [Araneus ventricosus]|uniref:Uncharacterized protein n=1 Tax=Araneus ventricosus TaxID=182803 RepID=A0A4Y2IVT9_ARAVE|nr:hypothetical protein AVEN_4077-1 [Araneus ventricosus]
MSIANKKLRQGGEVKPSIFTGTTRLTGFETGPWWDEEDKGFPITVLSPQPHAKIFRQPHHLSSSPASAKKPKLITSTPSFAPKSNLANSDKVLQSEPKVNLRTLHSSSSTRTPSPVLEIDLSRLVHHIPPTMATSIPDAEISTQNFLSDTSDIEGAIKEMSPIPMQELEDEEDLEVLYSRLKDKQDVPPFQRVPTEVLSHSADDPGSLHDQVDKIRGVLSSTTPNVCQALLLLDQLQADILATELINIKPQPQRVNRQTKNQVPSRTSQVSIPPSSPVEPSLNPTILLFPN